MKLLHPRLAILFIAICGLLYIGNHHQWTTNKVLNYDVFGYHNYLPATIIYKDITKYKYLDSIEQNYPKSFGSNKKYGLHYCAKDSNLCNQYPMGVAVFQAPLFILAHWYTVVKHPTIVDGYSKAYQCSVVLSTFLFGILGLVLLSEFLRNL